MDLALKSPDAPYRRATVDVQHEGHSLHDVCLALGLSTADEFPVLLEHGGVWCDRWRVADSDRIVSSGEVVTVHVPPGGAYETINLPSSAVLYEDDVLLVVNKPPGVYVAVTPWDTQGNLLHALRCFLKERDGVDYPVHLAHQLDRDTSGVLVVTKDRRANAGLQRAFTHHTIKKTYLGFATGLIVPNRWIGETGHGRGAHGLFRVYPLDQVGQPLPYGKNIVKYMRTEFKVVQRWEDATLVEAVPVTGRTHQIRLHLDAAGHPLLGDLRYKGPAFLGPLRLTHHLLHAQRLCFQHPLSLEPLEIEAPTPLLFREVADYLSGTQSQ